VDKAVRSPAKPRRADASRSQNSNDFEVNLSFDTQGGVEFGNLTGTTWAGTWPSCSTTT
jgi:hypothetical protein